MLLAFIFNNRLQAQTAGENIDVTHYEIHLNNINFTNHTLQCETYVTLNATANTSTVVLELKSLTVNAVLCETPGYGINGYSQSDDFLTIELSEALPAGQSITLDILYGGNTFNESWGGIMWTPGYVCNMGVGFESQPHNLGKCWFPCVDNFTDKATYDVYVTVDNNLSAVCGGNLENTVDNGNGTKTVHYNMPQEIATYHISFVAGDYVEWTDTYNGLERDIPITVYVKPAQINNVPGTFVHVKDIAAFYEEHFGPYPFNRIGYAITSVGCMEHVDNIGITSGVLTGNTTQEEYVAHELSHMYFGNKVTCFTAGDMWLNEGFAQFCGLFYREGVYGEDDFLEAMNTKINNITNWCKIQSHWIPLNNMPLDMTYDSDAIYNRGAVIVNTMMNYMGRDNFLEGIRHYLDIYSYGSASSENLRDALSESSGIDMDGFFNTYVFNGGMPHYSVKIIETTPNGNLFDTRILLGYQHLGSDHVGQNNRVEITFVGTDGQLQTMKPIWDGPEEELTTTLDFEPIAAFIDYSNHFLDAKTDVNRTIDAPSSLTQGKFKAIVNSVTDSVMLRIEDHYVGPDNDPGIPYLTISTSHYWHFFRNDFGNASISAQISYSNNASVDGDIIHSENDSVVLLYRANYDEPWHLLPCVLEGTWKVGRLNLSDTPSGLYTIGVVDKTLWSVNTQSTQLFNIFPIPTNGILNIQMSEDRRQETEYRITDLTGQTLMTGITQGQIDVSSLPSGAYTIQINGITKKFIVQ